MRARALHCPLALLAVSTVNAFVSPASAGSSALRHHNSVQRAAQTATPSYRVACAQLHANRDNSDDADTEEASSETWIQRATTVLQTPLNITFPWKGLAVFGGGTIAGICLTVNLILNPYGLGGPDMQRSMTLFENVLLDIKQSYVEEVDVSRLLQTAVGGMLRTLDPYTEFENVEQAQELQESVTGRYGGVGLVIAGDRGNGGELQQQQQSSGGKEGKGGVIAPPPIPSRGIQVISAFEGYAFDAGMRPGDRLISVGNVPVSDLTVEGVKDLLRGEPDTEVTVKFVREGLGITKGDTQEVTLTRRLIRLRDVRLSTLVGSASDGIAYVQLAGFSQEAGTELATALQSLNSQSPEGIKGLILDLRGNPGGLLESAVDVSAMLVPKGSDIVSAKGRAFGEVRYKSTIAPLLPPSTPLLVLTNSGTASAAEIVSGAVQDLDAGVIVGSGKGRTYGKGLVQSIKALPYNSALKYTVAKYYTPSGRCIQSVDYSRGGVAMAVNTLTTPPTELPDAVAPQIPLPQQPDVSLDDLPIAPAPPQSPLVPADGSSGSSINPIKPAQQQMQQQQRKNGASIQQLKNGGPLADVTPESVTPEVPEVPVKQSGSSGGANTLIYTATAIKDADRKEFKTLNGRTVRDGGGVEGDVVSPERRPSSLEIALLLQGAYFDFAGQWASTHTFTGSQSVATDATLKDFKQFVLAKQQSKEYKLEALYEPQLKALESALEEGGLKTVSSMRVGPLRDAILDEMARDFDLQREPIRTALEGAILSRYLPESMLLRTQLAKDDQFQLALSIAKNRPRYESIIAAPKGAAAAEQLPVLPPRIGAIASR